MLAGRKQEAHAEAKEVLKLNPEFSVDRFDRSVQIKNEEEKKRLIGALRKAFSFQSEP